MNADSRYSNAQNAALYDVLNPWDHSDDFSLSIVVEHASAGAIGTVGTVDVLDLGCGTGLFLERVRLSGHAGRLVGVDPDEAALAVARARASTALSSPRIEWMRGTAATLPLTAPTDLTGQFGIALMKGHAFQCLLGDAELDASLRAIRRALVEGGVFAFETRNPAVRAWESWASMPATHVTDADGRRLRSEFTLEGVDGELVTFSETLFDASDGGASRFRDTSPLRTDRTTLRFWQPDTVTTALDAAGFTVVAAYGDWARGPVTPTSRELVFVACAI